MKKRKHLPDPGFGLTASVTREGRLYVAQCLEIDVASQGRSERAALSNLAEALELHFEPPVATTRPTIRKVAVGRRAA